MGFITLRSSGLQPRPLPPTTKVSLSQSRVLAQNCKSNSFATGRCPVGFGKQPVQLRLMRVNRPAGFTRWPEPSGSLICRVKPFGAETGHHKVNVGYDPENTHLFLSSEGNRAAKPKASAAGLWVNVP